MNIVLLQGVLSSEPRSKELPSGDLLTSWEVTTGLDGEKLSVPVVWFQGPKSIAKVTSGDEVVVVGAVRRRYYHGGQRLQSSTEVVARKWAPASRQAAVSSLVEGALAKGASA